MAITFEIHYNENPEGMYFTGQLVMGHAVINLDEPIPIKGIKLRVRGFSEVRWKENNSSNSSSTYSDEEEYFHTTTECVETKELEYILEPGTYTYNFECPLPLHCPTSFEGTYGRVHYETRITIVRPRKFNKSYSMGFSVLKIVDLNHLPHLRIPAEMELSKNFCCGPCKSKPLMLSMHIPQTSYVPGEFIDVSAKLVNHSSTEVEQVRMVLNLIALYSVSTSVKEKIEKIAIAKRKFGGFEQSTLELKDQIQVPPTPPTCVDLCRIIKLTYEVEVTARVKGVHIPPSVAIPVIIGNVPYLTRSTDISNTSQTTSEHHAGLDGELPPPSYEEALFVQPLDTTFPEDDENTDIQIENFTPRYPFYNTQAPTETTQDNSV